MGKKRRILATKKFNAKHSAHPRMKKTDDARITTPTTVQTTATENIKLEATPEPEPIVEAPTPTLAQEKVETKTVTPTVKKTTTTKAKKTTTPRKKTTTKSTTPRKRTTKKKTTSATA